MSMFALFKKYAIEKLIGNERRMLSRIETQQTMVLTRLGISVEAGAVAQKIQSDTDLLRKISAEQNLSSQLARIADLDLTKPARSVIFLHHSYYHFYYLAQALRKRGWRAISVSLDDPNGAFGQYFHGEDVNLYSADEKQLRANAEVLFEFAKTRFSMFHFAGEGRLSFFPWNFSAQEPADILEWRALGKKVAYSIGGCKDSTAQSSVHGWAVASTGRSLCDNCVWQHRPDVCSDESNLAWGRQLHRFCDAIFSEMQPSLDYLGSSHAKVIRGPHTMPNSEEFWHPDLDIPEAYRLPREPGEVLVYHSVGNYDFRNVGDRNIKGTPAVVAAVDRLRSEGVPVRLIFFSNVANTTVRYYQAQADIVVDQLWAGSYGAAGREAMMLGKPVIGFVNPFEFQPADQLEVLTTTPIISADVDTVYDAIRMLALDPEKRRTVGAATREFAVKWHGTRASARRYEEAYDRIWAKDITSKIPDKP